MNDLVYYVYVPILGILIAAFLHSINTRHHEKRRVFNDKAIEFTKAFQPELEKLLNWTTLDSMGVEHIISDAYGTHQAAIINFRTVLNRKEKKRLDKAWEKYSNIAKSPSEFKFTKHGDIVPLDTKIVFHNKKLAIKMIQEFFNIAKPK